MALVHRVQMWGNAAASEPPGPGPVPTSGPAPRGAAAVGLRRGPGAPTPGGTSGTGAGHGPPGPACRYVIGLMEGDSPHGSSVFGSRWAAWSLRAPRLSASIPGVPRVRTKRGAFPPRVPESQREAPGLAHTLGRVRAARPLPYQPPLLQCPGPGWGPRSVPVLVSGVRCAGRVSTGRQALLGAPWGGESACSLLRAALTAVAADGEGGLTSWPRAFEPPLCRPCWGRGAEPCDKSSVPLPGPWAALSQAGRGLGHIALVCLSLGCSLWKMWQKRREVGRSSHRHPTSSFSMRVSRRPD